MGKRKMMETNKNLKNVSAFMLLLFFVLIASRDQIAEPYHTILLAIALIIMSGVLIMRYRAGEVPKSRIYLMAAFIALGFVLNAYYWFLM